MVSVVVVAMGFFLHVFGTSLPVLKRHFPTLSSCMVCVPRQLDDNGCLDPVQAHLFQIVFLDVRRLGWASLRNNGARYVEISIRLVGRQLGVGSWALQSIFPRSFSIMFC